MLNKIKLFFLNKSDSFQYYKENYYKLTKINEENERIINELKNKVKIQESQIDLLNEEKNKLKEIYDETTKINKYLEILDKKIALNKLKNEEQYDNLNIILNDIIKNIESYKNK